MNDAFQTEWFAARYRAAGNAEEREAVLDAWASSVPAFEFQSDADFARRERALEHKIRRLRFELRRLRVAVACARFMERRPAAVRARPRAVRRACRRAVADSGGAESPAPSRLPGSGFAPDGGGGVS